MKLMEFRNVDPRIYSYLSANICSVGTMIGDRLCKGGSSIKLGDTKTILKEVSFMKA